MSDFDNTQKPIDTPQEEQVISQAEQKEAPPPVNTNR